MPIQFTVTLKSLRTAGACFSGYNKVVRSMQGKPFSDEDEERESYIQFRHDDPIPMLSILESNGLDDALWALRCVPNVDRDARLFGVWCARQVQHLMTDPRSLNALDVAERYADGAATKDELSAAWAAAWDAACAAAWDAAWDEARDAACAAARAASRDEAWDTAWDAAWDEARDAACAAARDAAREDAWDDAWDAARAAQKEMFIKMCRGEAPWQ